MISLTYLSTAVDAFDEEQLGTLLEVSRRNNHAAGLSGMMLYAGGHFIQTLEGDEDVVDAAFTRIAADPRHRDVIVTLREPIDDRDFPDWSMGFERVEDAEVDARLPGFNAFLAAGTEEERTATHLGRPGIFHRVFRDRMR